MGRLSRYKKLKSVDPFAKNRTWEDGYGCTSTTVRKAKRRSKTATKLHEQKAKRRLKRKGGGLTDFGGSNGGLEEGFDLPPAGGDEFDMSDLTGSVKRFKAPSSVIPLLEDDKHKIGTVSATSTGKADKLDMRGVKIQTSDAAAQAASTATLVAAGVKDKSKITAKTTAEDIMASLEHDAKSKKKRKTKDAGDETTAAKKRQHKKDYLAKRKAMKNGRKRKANHDSDSDDDDGGGGQHRGSASNDEGGSGVGVSGVRHGRTSAAFDEQAERPPTFTKLPRGAKKKQQFASSSSSKQESSYTSNGGMTDEARRKEQRALEAMREQAVARYAVLKANRRNQD